MRFALKCNVILVVLTIMMSRILFAQGETDMGAELEAIKALLMEQQAQIQRQQDQIEHQQAEIERLQGVLDVKEKKPEEPERDEHVIEEVYATVQEIIKEEGIKPVYDKGFVFRSADEQFRLNIGGWIQPRYEYTFRSNDNENISSFYMRRVRLDISGHVFNPALTFRIMPEFARTANLRDAWINYEFERELQARFGQYTVPFQWHRYIAPRRQHFAERSNVSETFGFPQGRDIGLGFHGINKNQTFSYGAGFFDGAGRNIELSNSSGNMASGRVNFSLLGTLPREESDLAWSDEPQLSFGAGLQGATRSEVREWDLGRSLTADRRVDWGTATGDVRVALKGFSVAGEGFVRRVSPKDSLVDSYTGAGWGFTGGYFIIPKQYEFVGRYNHLRLDNDDGDTRETEWGLGLNIYHNGHDWKTRLNFLSYTTDDLREQSLLLEHHLNSDRKLMVSQVMATALTSFCSVI
jgi:phosphate-selective porin OprO and OprP